MLSMTKSLNPIFATSETLFDNTTDFYSMTKIADGFEHPYPAGLYVT
jgi:hypothetical protein